MASPYPILLGAAVAMASPAAARPAAREPATAAVEAVPRAEAPASATRIPEPDTIALFLMGATGLIVGRRLSRSKRRQPDG